MTTFFITPYEPTDDETKWKALKTASDLRIDPVLYKQQMLERWPDTQFFSTSEKMALQWSLYTRSGEGTLIPGGIGSLYGNLQIVAMETPNEAFFLWHRSVIPDEYPLFLFNSSSWNSLKLTPDITIETIERFVGGRS